MTLGGDELASGNAKVEDVLPAKVVEVSCAEVKSDGAPERERHALASKEILACVACLIHVPKNPSARPQPHVTQPLDSAIWRVLPV